MALIIVSVGTDHHRFDRIMDWLDNWEPASAVEVVVQRGTSKPSTKWETESLIPHKELLELFARATAVVCHGGPSTVMDARLSGKLPIVVARDPEHGEHVDGHQIAFARHLSRNEVALVVNSEAELHGTLNEALVTPDSFAIEADASQIPGVVRFGEEVDALLGTVTPVDIEAASESANG